MARTATPACGESCRKTVEPQDPKPLRRSSTLHRESGQILAVLKERNRSVRNVNRLGRRAWCRWSGAYPRARVESAFFRYKPIRGREIRARTLAGERGEARIGAKIVHRMAALGMPESHRAA